MNEEIARVAEATATTFGRLPLVVGVDLGGTQMRAAVLRGPTLLARVGLLTGANPTPERTIPRIFTMIQQVLTEANATLDTVAGIGIGAPGPLNSRTGVVFAPPNLPGWENVPIGDIVREKFQVPIYVENDANAAALGEYLFGAGRGARDMVYLTISTGIGGGVLIDGKIQDGVSGTAAELGHMTVDLHGPRCNCGNVGCLERLASGTAIARFANEAIASGGGEQLVSFALAHQQHEDAAAHRDTETPIHVNARMVALAAEAGVALAQRIIANAAEALGFGLVNILHIFNPELVILGGGVTQMGALLFEPVRRIVSEHAMQVPRKAARIVSAQLGANVGLIGAGSLIYYHEQANEQ